MNNSNIINVQRKGDYFPNDLSKEFYERKSLYDFRNINSPPLSEKICRMKNRLRSGKSHEPFDVNNYVNYNFYNNNTYLRNNKFETYNSNDGRKNIYIHGQLRRQPWRRGVELALEREGCRRNEEPPRRPRAGLAVP